MVLVLQAALQALEVVIKEVIMIKRKSHDYGVILKGIFCFFLIFLLVCPGQAQTISNMKSLLSESGQVLFGDEPNTIMVIDHPENINKIAEYIDMVDVEPQQVHIEARIVEVKLQGENALGIDWTAFAQSGGLNFGNFDMYSGTASSGITTNGVINYKSTVYPPISGTTTESPFNLTLAQNNINVVMKALANTYDSDILSAPSVTTINNHEATIQMKDVYPWAEPEVSTTDAVSQVSWSVNFEETGIMLKVTPTISENGKIVLDLQPEVSEKTDDYEITLQPTGTDPIVYTIPIVATRQAKTKVVVGSGETLIIGGLIKNKEIEGETKIPFLGDIPYIGYLFKSQKKTRDKTELVIFVSPTIINTPELAYSAKMEKKIREDVEGKVSKIDMGPIKEAALKAAEKEKVQAEKEELEAEKETVQAETEEELLDKKINALYSKGVRLYFNQQFRKSEAMFKEILRYDPDHKGALNYLENKLPGKFQEERAEKPVQQEAKKPEPQVYQKPWGLPEKAEPVKIQSERIDIQQAKEAQQQVLKEQVKNLQIQEAAAKKAAQVKAKQLYSSAVSLYRDKRYQEAYAKFQELDSFSPDYARSSYYLVKIPELISAAENKRKSEQELTVKRETELKAKQLYSSAVSLYKEKQYERAYAEFQKLDNLMPGYQRTGSYLTRIPELIQQQQSIKRAKEAREKEAAIKGQVKDAYQTAISLYKAKSYPAAYDKFSQVQSLIPGYRETAYYLNKIPKLLEKKRKDDEARFEKDRGQAIKDMLNACE